jgi:hypothetical protein
MKKFLLLPLYVALYHCIATGKLTDNPDNLLTQ